MYLTNPIRVAASVAAAVVLLVSAISVDGAALGLSADDATGQPRDRDSLVYTTESRQVEVGWDASAVDAGTLFGDTATLRLHAAEPPT